MQWPDRVGQGIGERTSQRLDFSYVETVALAHAFPTQARAHFLQTTEFSLDYLQQEQPWSSQLVTGSAG